MRRSTIALLAPFAALALAVPVVTLGLPATPAGAIVNACTFGQYPNAPGGASQLSVACSFGPFATSSSMTIEDYPQAVWENGATGSLPVVTTAGSNVINENGTAPPGFDTAEINHPLTGFLVPAHTFITQVLSPTQAVLNNPATATGTEPLAIDNGTIRSVADGVTTAGSTTITSASANFVSADVGRMVTGTNIPAGDTIASVTDAATAVLTTAATAAGTAQTFTIGAGETTSTARALSDAQMTAGSTTLTSASADFQSSDVQLAAQTNCGIPSGTYITSVTDASDVVLSEPATVTRPFSVADGVTTSGSTTVTSATAAFSLGCDLDKRIAGPGIPSGAYISAVTNATTITISAPATATATGVALTESPGATVVIGGSGAATTVSGSDGQVSTLNTMGALNPSLVKGSPPCSANAPTGTTIGGHWMSPSGSTGTGTLDGGQGTDPYSPVVYTQVSDPGLLFLPPDSIGEIVYQTSVISIAAFVVDEPANTPGEIDTAAHTDIVMPFVPSALALCGSSGIGFSLSFGGIGGEAFGIGPGRPDWNSVRGIQDLGPGSTPITGTAYVITGKGSSPYSGTCTTKYPATVSRLACD